MSWLSEALGQDAAKKAGRLQDQATKTAEDTYADRALYRNTGRNTIANPTQYNLASIYGGGPEYEAISDPTLAQSSLAELEALNQLKDGPDRLAMIREALGELDAENTLQRKAGSRAIGQSAATLGRIGNQGVSTSLGNLEAEIQRGRNTAEAGLIRDATEATQGDILKRASLAGTISDRALGRATADRAYKSGIAQQGVENRAAQFGAERNAADQDTRRGLSLAEFGYGGSPEAAYRNAADVAAQDAASKSALVGDVVGSATKFLTGGFRPVKPPTPAKAP